MLEFLLGNVIIMKGGKEVFFYIIIFLNDFKGFLIIYKY